MNRILHLLSIDLKLLSKTKVFYLKLILFPCALIFILGTMFGNTSSKLSTFDVAYYSEDTSVTEASQNFSLGETLKDNVLKSKAVKSIFNLKTVNSYAEGKKLVKDKKAAAFIYVPKNFTKDYINDTRTNITLIADNDNQIDKSIVKDILDRFNKSIETIHLEESEVLSNLTTGAKVNPAEMQKVINQIKNTDNYADEITKVSTSKDAKPLNIMQYESIAMIVMFSILTSFELAHNIVDDKLNNTQFRIKSTPTLDLQYVLGKVLGMVLAIVVQMSIVMLISHLAFGVYWGNIFDIALITLSYGFCVGTIVFCAGAAAKDQMSISSFAPIVLYGGSFLGGSFASVDSFPPFLAKIQQVIPNGKAINSYLKICQGGGFSDIYTDLIALVVIGLVFLILSLRLFSERGIGENATNNNDKKSIEAAV